MLLIVVVAFGRVSKEFPKILEELELNRRHETIWTTVLLRSARIFIVSWGDSQSLDFSKKKAQANVGVKISQEMK